MSASEYDSLPLSPIDACWYHLDRRGQNVDVGALLFFEESLSFEALGELVVKNLLPRRQFRQRVVEGMLGLGGPAWQDDPHFRLDAHLHHLAVPDPGDDEALAELVGDLMSTPLNLERPLWHLYLLDRGSHGSAIMARIHHCIGDGFALGRLLFSLGTSKDGVRPSTPPPADEDDDGDEQGLLERLGDLLFHPDEALETAQLAARVARSLGHLVMLPFEPATRLKGPLSFVRRAGWSDHIELERVKALGRRFDATVNDVLMTALTGALRTYLIGAGEAVEGLNLRAIMPVNLRKARFLEEMPDELGNHFGLVFLDLPVDRIDPQERLIALKSEIDRLKASPEAFIVFEILQALGHTPAFFEHLVEDIFLKKASLVATNVPGPREPLYFAGRRMKDALFWAPHPGHLGLGLSIFSYAGRIRIGIRSDADVVTDPGRLASYFYDEFERLEAGQAEVGVDRQPPPPP